MQAQYNVLGWSIDLHFHNCKLAIEIAQNRHSDRNIDCEIKRQKAMEQKLGCKFFRIDPEKEDFDIFWAINEIFRHITKSTKKTLISKISPRLLGLEYRSDNIIKSKAMKFIVKKLFPDYKWQWKPIVTVVKKYCKRKFKC